MQQQRQSQYRGNSAQDMSRRMICGGIAGCIAKTVTNPLERIKMLSQTGEHGLKQTSVISLYRNIIKNEGVIGLWAGNGANLLRIFPAKAVVFSTNDLYQDIFRRLLSTNTESENQSDPQNLQSQKLPGSMMFLSGYVVLYLGTNHLVT